MTWHSDQFSLKIENKSFLPFFINLTTARKNDKKRENVNHQPEFFIPNASETKVMPFIPQQSSLKALSLFKRPKYAPKRSKQTISCSFLLLEDRQVRKYEKLKSNLSDQFLGLRTWQTPTNSEKQALSDLLLGSLTLRGIA